MWREARGAILRREYEDTMARMRDADQHARAAFLNNINQTIEHVVAVYSAASESEREALLNDARIFKQPGNLIGFVRFERRKRGCAAFRDGARRGIVEGEFVFLIHLKAPDGEATGCCDGGLGSFI